MYPASSFATNEVNAKVCTPCSSLRAILLHFYTFADLCALVVVVYVCLCRRIMQKDSPQYDPYSNAELEEVAEGSYKKQRMEYVNLRVRRLRADGRSKPDTLLIEEAKQAFDAEYSDGKSRRVPKAKRSALDE